MKAAIVIDAWKLSIFTEELKANGIKFEQSPGVTSDTLTLTVITDDPGKIHRICKRCQTKAAELKN